MIDFTQFPSPCYIMEEELLRKNLSLIKQVADKAGVEIILAFKSFAMWRSFPIFREYIAHSTASSVYEARLALEEFGSKAHTYSPAYTEQDFPEIMRCSSHITFNSLAQFQRFYPMFWQKGVGSPAVFVLIPNIPKWKQNFIILVLPVPVLALQPICCPKFFRRVLRVFIAIVIASRRLLNWSILYSTLKRNSPIGFHR